MASRRGSRVVLNRQVFETDGPVALAVADGLFEFARRVVVDANVPDLPPVGKGLIESGGAAAWVDGKKVGDSLVKGRAVKKPRAVRTPKGSIVAIGGFDFPGHLVHNGSIHNRAKPFLAQSLDAHASSAMSIITAAGSPRIRALR